MYIYLLISSLCYLYNVLFPKKNFLKSIVILSGDYDWDTTKRVRTGIELKEKQNAKLIICGKYKNKIMKDELAKYDLKDFVTQDKSTNTYEDAFYLKGVNNKQDIFPIALVTSQPHMRRSVHTFQRVFPGEKIYAYPTNDLLNIYSPFIPTGWIGVIINIYKDVKYNGRFI